MATYNGGRFIKQQIDSIMSQLSSNDELIISDDGSTDSTLDIIASYNDARIKVFQHKKQEESGMYKNFRYATANFENALQKVKGDYIFFADQDDVWIQNKVAHCIELLQKYDCVVHNNEQIDENGNGLFVSWSKTPIHKTLLMNVLDNHFRGCCMAFKSELLKIVLPIPKKIIGHDYWIGTLACHYGNVFYEMTPLIQSRRYTESVSAKRRTSILYKIKFRMDLLFALIKRISQIEKKGGKYNA